MTRLVWSADWDASRHPSEFQMRLIVDDAHEFVVKSCEVIPPEKWSAGKSMYRLDVGISRLMMDAKRAGVLNA